MEMRARSSMGRSRFPSSIPTKKASQSQHPGIWRVRTERQRRSRAHEKGASRQTTMFPELDPAERHTLLLDGMHGVHFNGTGSAIGSPFAVKSTNQASRASGRGTAPWMWISGVPTACTGELWLASSPQRHGTFYKYSSAFREALRTHCHAQQRGEPKMSGLCGPKRSFAESLASGCLLC
jgi:hypothetical protein